MEAKKTTATEKNEFKKGTYKALAEIPIYDGIGKDKKQKRIGDLSASCRANKGRGHIYALATYAKDEQFSIVEVMTEDKVTYGKTPSGYICIADDKKEYCSCL